MSNLLPVTLVFLFAVIITAQRKLRKTAQPLRLELASKGEEFLVQPNLPKMVRCHVNNMLDTAFNDRIDMLIVVLVMPLVGLYIAVSPRRFLASMKKHEIADVRLRAEYNDIIELYDKIAMANHPILWFVIQIDMLLFIFVAILFAGLRGYLPNKAVQDGVMNFIEAQKLKLPFHHRPEMA